MGRQSEAGDDQTLPLKELARTSAVGLRLQLHTFSSTEESTLLSHAGWEDAASLAVSYLLERYELNICFSLLVFFF
jgi:hypothetical protein